MTAETMDTPAVTVPTATPPHPLREFWGYFSANKGAVAGLVVIITVVLVALLADVLAPAIGYFMNGHPIVERAAATIDTVKQNFRDNWPTSAAVYLPGNKVPAPGSLSAQIRPPWASMISREM